jgi:glycosyltransferase involved in cell wall biosynthesis
LKALLFANTDWYLYNFRLSLARTLRQKDYDVLLLSPPGKYGALLEEAGFQWVEFPLSRRGMNPFWEIWTVFRLAILYRSIQPQVVHHFTIKCVIYGSLAAKLGGIKHIINAVTGLGYIFMENNLKTSLLRRLVFPVYRIALAGTRVIFQNPEDREKFASHKLVRLNQTSVIRGSGVDVIRFRCQEEPPGTPVVLLASRMLWSKGIAEFIAAAKRIKQQGVQARFVLVGDTYPDNPDAIPRQQLLEWQKEGAVEWWGWHDDMVEMMQKCHIACLPSNFREGVPRSLIEAAATCRPIVATNVTGCREIVKNGVNGYLVPPRDVQALSERLLELILDPLMRLEMGRAGREMVVRDYSDRQVITETLLLYPENSL